MRGFVTIGGETHALTLIADGEGGYAVPGVGSVAVEGEEWSVAGKTVDAIVVRNGGEVWAHLDGRAYRMVWHDPVSHYAEAAGGTADNNARAPMPGAVVSVAVAAGYAVAAGDTLMIIESMKLETAIRAPRDGVVETVHVAAGQTFERDALLVTLKQKED